MPTIKISKTSKTVSVGEKVTLPKIVVTDDCSENPQLFIWVFTPNGDVSVDITSSKKFTASVKGTYRVRIVAFDDAGNMSSVNYIVTAK